MNTGSGWKWGYVQDKLYYPDRIETIALTRPARPAMLGNMHDEVCAGCELFQTGAKNLVEDNYLAGKLSYYTANNTIAGLQSSHDMVFWNNKGLLLF